MVLQAFVTTIGGHQIRIPLAVNTVDIGKGSELSIDRTSFANFSRVHSVIEAPALKRRRKAD